jgi:hypothetical protein
MQLNGDRACARDNANPKMSKLYRRVGSGLRLSFPKIRVIARVSRVSGSRTYRGVSRALGIR